MEGFDMILSGDVDWLNVLALSETGVQPLTSSQYLYNSCINLSLSDMAYLSVLDLPELSLDSHAIPGA